MYEISITEIGKEIITKAIQANHLIKFNAFKLSSEIVSDTTSFDNVVYQALINEVETQQNELILKCIVPEDVGGFWLRSIAIFDDKENMIALGNVPKLYKEEAKLSPVSSEYIIKLQIDNAESINVSFNSEACSSMANYYQLAESLICLMNHHSQLAWGYAKEHNQSLTFKNEKI